VSTIRSCEEAEKRFYNGYSLWLSAKRAWQSEKRQAAFAPELEFADAMLW
jgi:hypothetical protein